MEAGWRAISSPLASIERGRGVPSSGTSSPDRTLFEVYGERASGSPLLRGRRRAPNFCGKRPMLERALSRWWVVFIAVVVVHGITTGGQPRTSPDTQLYVRLANDLLAGDLSSTFNIVTLRWTKIIFITLLALARTISPESWREIMMVVNVSCSGAVAVLLVHVARRASRTIAGPAAALLLYLGCYEVFQWMKFVLTDMLFCLASFIPFVLVARRILVPGEPRRPVLLAVSLVVAVFTRQPGIVLIPLVLFAELVLVECRVKRGAAAAMIVAAALVAFAVRTTVVHDPSLWPFGFIKPKIEEFAAREKTGEIVYDRLESHRPSPRTWGDHAVMVADRLVRFFQFTSSGYSRAHNLANVVYFTPLYLLGLAGAVYGFRSGDVRRRALVIALLMWIGVFAYFHALTILDYDWRFRMPLVPHLILLAVIGGEALSLRCRARPRAVGYVSS